MAKKEKEAKKQKGSYFKDMKAELKKVIWPTPKQLFNNTMAVITFTLIIAAIVFVLDLAFDSLMKYGVAPLQDKIQSTYGETTNEDSNTVDGENTNTLQVITEGDTDTEVENADDSSSENAEGENKDNSGDEEAANNEENK